MLFTPIPLLSEWCLLSGSNPFLITNIVLKWLCHAKTAWPFVVSHHLPTSSAFTVKPVMCFCPTAFQCFYNLGVVLKGTKQLLLHIAVPMLYKASLVTRRPVFLYCKESNASISCSSLSCLLTEVQTLHLKDTTHPSNDFVICASAAHLWLITNTYLLSKNSLLLILLKWT